MGLTTSPVLFAGEGGYVPRQLGIEGIQRDYLLREPLGQAEPPRALVILLHGHAGSAKQLTGNMGRAAPYRVWSRIADRENLLLVAPDGLAGPDGRRGWNDCRGDIRTNPDSDDMAFLAKLVQSLKREYGLRKPPVFVVGTSNGGVMALRAATERPQVTAVAALAASMPARSKCAPPRQPVPVLFINGTADRLMPFDGGAIDGQARRGTVLSAPQSAELWARLAGLSGPPEIRRFAASSTGGDTIEQTWRRADGQPQVVFYRIEGGGHIEPSRSERYARLVTRLLGLQSDAIESAEVVWAFFAAQLPSTR
jgi:polyhydroxybutyrate depolymerase